MDSSHRSLRQPWCPKLVTDLDEIAVDVSSHAFPKCDEVLTSCTKFKILEIIAQSKNMEIMKT